MEPPDDPPADEFAEVDRLIGDAMAKRRGYADYWLWPPDKALAERGVAEALMAFLAAREGWVVRSLGAPERDPPDVVAVLTDGRRVGVEVTEIVDRGVAGRHGARRAAERRGRAPSATTAANPHEVAWWTPERLRDALQVAVARKDVAAAGGPLDLYLVALHTDEMTITTAVAEEATRGLRVAARHMDAAFLVMSYHPGEGTAFPGGYPVFPVGLDRSRP